MLPEYFTDEEILPLLLSSKSSDVTTDTTDTKTTVAVNTVQQYPTTCGLCMKLKTAVTRVVKHTKMPGPSGDGDTYSSRLDKLMRHYVSQDELLQSGYSADDIWDIATMISQKFHTLNVKLQKELCVQPLVLQMQSGADGGRREPSFSQDFIQQVQEYFSKVRRPEGTFELQSSRHKDRIERIAKLPRELCERCIGRKCVYCGECGGLRMKEAADLLPDRIDLPFDVLLLVHWNESLHKCTGIHSAVLSREGSVETCAWPKETKIGLADDEGVLQVKRRIVASLDSDSDLVLFPSKDAIVADDVVWRMHNDSGSATAQKKRLVVLEATWQHGKVLAKELLKMRIDLGLPPLRFVTLKENIVGQYWRFHNEGHSAVSTIEAICHTAIAAGLSDRHAEDFLFLFNLQKYRLLERIKTDGKQPRAIDVTASVW